MKIQRPLFWHQGLFLQPQHFQLQDRAAHSGLIPFLTYHGPHFWGVGAAEIDRGALGTGTFNLESGHFLFQDGSYLEFPGNALVQPRAFDANLEEGKPLQVYLGMRKWNETGENVTVIDTPDDLGSACTRFVAWPDPEEVRDLHGQGPDGQVRRLHYLLKLCWDKELDKLGDYDLIPLAQLENSGGVRLSTTFIPPSLTLAATASLMKLVREVRDQLAARIHQLEQYKKQRGVQNAEFGSRDMVYLLALTTLSRHLPHLFHLTEAPAVHPWVAYGALRQLLGELSSFSLRVNFLGESEGGVRLLPLYDHKRLWDCFSAAQDLVTRLLDDITAGPDYVVRLVNDGTYFSAELKPSLLEGGSRFFLALKTEEDPQVVHRLVESAAKLSAREHLPVLTSHALPGLALEPLHVPPQELPRRANTLYFSVDHRHDQWNLVTKGNNIALNWDTAPEDLEVELMIVEKLQNC
jgi:type VI secretion system protein ImpJ